MDVEGGIKPGEDFVEVLRAQVAQSDVLLAVIGPRWVELLASQTAGSHDFVVIEIQAALEQGKRVIPVLVGGAKFPAANILPEPVRAFARKNAVGLRPDRFKADCLGLANALREAFAAIEAEHAARTEAERQAAEEARKQREAEEQARAEEMERAARERAAAGLTPLQIHEAKELANWDFIKDSASPDEFRDHLARFALGTTEPFRLQDGWKQLLWADISKSRFGNEIRVRIYREFHQGTYLEGRNVAQARAGLAALEKAAEDVARPETGERARAKPTHGPPWPRAPGLRISKPSCSNGRMARMPRTPRRASRSCAAAAVTRRGVLKGFGNAAAGGGILYSTLMPGEYIWRQIYDRSARTLSGHAIRRHFGSVLPRWPDAGLGQF